DSSLAKEGDVWIVSGDPMEGALLAFAGKVLGNAEDVRRDTPRQAVLPFDSRHRFMATKNSGPAGVRIHAKGAPEDISALCTHMIGADGTPVPIDREEITAITAELAAQGQRVLALA
ncbi:MAG TPA: carbonate dehydratase, partial [Hyphomonas sp.]|nr:carbonate dehydratase [Hyphomonas sp.]